MKYSFRYFKNSQQIKNADEIIVQYDENTKATELITFIKECEGKRIVAAASHVDLSTKDISCFKVATAASLSGFAVKINAADKEHIPALKEAGVNFFFDDFCSSWDILHAQLDLGVSDVYIVEELLFQLDKVKDVCGDVIIRAFPNVVQSTATGRFDVKSTFKCAWISPYDVSVYEKYIDIFEFFGPIVKQDVLYRIYKEEQWPDDLNQIILGLNENVNGNMLPPGFGSRRTTCGKRCNYSTCTFCDRAEELALTMHEEGLSFRLEELHGR